MTGALVRMWLALDRWQIPLYLAALVLGFLLGALLPGSGALGVAINPAIGLLLYVTFLGVPFRSLGRAFRDVRFLVALFAVNFVLVPAIVFGLSRFVAADQALLLGLLLVLLCPCVDYVIVFSGLAGAASEKLLAAAPLLMLAQLLLLPLCLFLIAGPSTVGVIDVGPFVEAFLLLIALPLVLAAATQWAAPRARPAKRLTETALHAMVPLMMVVLFIVVASQAHRVLASGTALLVLVPIYAGFLVIMAAVGVVTARVARLDPPTGRALTFSGATRNSLVVLPLALALPASLTLAPAAVVTQTLVELVGMVVYVRAIPRLVRAPRPGRSQVT